MISYIVSMKLVKRTYRHLRAVNKKELGFGEMWLKVYKNVLLFVYSKFAFKKFGFKNLRWQKFGNKIKVKISILMNKARFNWRKSKIMIGEWISE